MLEWQKLKDRLFFPLLAFLSTEQAHALGLTPLDDERIVAVLRHCRGLTLDIGCGANNLVNRYRGKHGKGIGVDVYPWPGADLLCNTSCLPFASSTFDTVAMLACLNHVPSSMRDSVLRETRRVLKDNGQLLITMINPFIGFFTHKIRHRHDPDQLCRGMSNEEEYGLWTTTIQNLLQKNGFRLTKTVPFVFWLNRLYIAEKAA